VDLIRAVVACGLALATTACAWPERRLVPPASAPADATAFLQRELDRGGRIVLPPLAGGRCYRTRGLWVTRPGTQLIASGACLEVTGPGPVRFRSPDGDPIPAAAGLYVTRTFGIRISGLRLIVPKEAQSYGIAVFGRNVAIDELTVEGAPIDAVVIGGRGSEPARDVTITRSRLLGGRRNVVSVVSAVGLTLEQTLVTGAVAGPDSPSAGIDVEPDDREDAIVNVRIVRNRIARNAGPGILLALSTAYGLPLRATGIVIAGNRIVGNSHGDTPSQHGGIAFQGGQADGKGWVRVADNVVQGNGGAGLQGHPTEGTVLRIEAAGNDLRGNEDGPTSFVRVGRGSRLHD
jgi:hypothetical protein